MIGAGFLPGESVGAELHSAPVDLGTFIADADGKVTVTFTVPAYLAPGLHHVVLTGLSSNRSVTIPLTVTARTSLATTGGDDPSGGAAVAILLLLLGAAVRLLSRRRRHAAAHD